MTLFRKAAFVIFLCIQCSVVAQQPVIEVPNEIEFAGIKLKLTSDARKDIQMRVNNLMKCQKCHQLKVDRANLYFPLMEKVMEEEGFPSDYKYLAMQESGLEADAVSSSNAVGYWQFKKESAIEVGLRVDGKVDERMNIIASTVGATRYLRRNNQTFDNWIYALLSYNLGLTGAKNKVDTKYYGAKSMTIDGDMHWYVLTFLAHKLAFEGSVGNSSKVDLVLIEYIDGANKTLDEIANQHQLSQEQIKKFNIWLKTEKIPDDKIYSVILGVPVSKKEAILASTETKPEGKAKKESYQTISDVPLRNYMTIIVVVNKTKVILARRGDTPAKLAFKGEISREDFLKYNEMKSFEDVRSNTFYYLEPKRNKAMVLFHVVQYGESLWDIAHNYGVKMESIRDKNRIEPNEAIAPGRVLYLRTKRPKNKPIEVRQVEPPRPILFPVRDTLTAAEIILKYGPKDSTQSLVTPEVDTRELVWHTVAQGETLFGIAKMHAIATDSIVTWNGMPDYKLSIGQRLIVGKKPIEPQQLTHIVVAGETIYKIATFYKVTTKEIQEWNNKQDLNLKVGEKLIIKRKI